MTLQKKEQHLVRVAAATAMGHIEELQSYLNTALQDGVSINELKELMIQLYAYCGFPRSLNGLSALMVVITERQKSGTNDDVGQTPKPIPVDKSRFELGDEVQRELTGGPVKGPLFDFAPAIDAFLKEHLFADIFLRGVLSYQEREIITIATLACIGVISQLTSHIRIGMNTGLVVSQINSIAEVLNEINEASAAKNIRTILKTIC